MFDASIVPTRPFGSFAEATERLERICRQLSVRHLSYWCVSYEGEAPDQVTWIATYDPAYMNHYMSTYTPLGDPVFGMLDEIVDWAEVNAADPAAQAMQDQAARYGIAGNGLSYHFKDESGLFVMFSVNVDSAAADWHWRRDALIEPMKALAHVLHLRAKPLVESRRLAA
jgi:Autoinducer binding domain